MAFSVEESISKIETLLWNTKDVGQVFEPFRELVEAVLDSQANGKKYEKALEDLFRQIESRLTWNLKDAEKVQRRLEIYRIMIKAYKFFDNQDAIFDCYNKIVRRSIVTITSRNIKKYLNRLYEDFENGYIIILTKNPHLEANFWPTVKMVLSHYEVQNFPKDMKLYDIALDAKAVHLSFIGNNKEALAIQKERLASKIKFMPSERADGSHLLVLLPYYHNIIKLYDHLGQHKNCLKTCEVLLRLYEKIGDLNRFSQEFPIVLIEPYVYALHYRAFSLAKRRSPDAPKAIADLQSFREKDPTAKKFTGWKHCDERFWVVFQPYLTDQVVHEEIVEEEGVSELIEKGKALLNQKKFFEAHKMFKLAANASMTLDDFSRNTNVLHIMFLDSKGLCNSGDHLEAIDRLKGCIKKFSDTFNRKLPVKVTLGDVYEAAAKCFYHVAYFDESLEAFKKAIKYPDKAHLLKNYAQLLICTNKLNKAANFVTGNRQAFEDDHAAMIYYLSKKNMDKVDEILKESKKKSPMMNFIMQQRWVERGTEEYVGIYRALTERENDNLIKEFVNSCVREKKPQLGFLTKHSLMRIDWREAVKFHKYLVKVLKSGATPDAKKLKIWDEQIRSWSKSVSISVFAQKKVKLNRRLAPFVLFKSDWE